MPKPNYLNSEDEANLVIDVRALQLKMKDDSSQQIAKISKKISLFPVSILIVNGDWYILSPRVRHDSNLRPESEHCWNYKLQFPEDEKALPTISDEPYLIKKTVIKKGPNSPSLNAQLASLNNELEVTRACIDSHASEVWRDAKTNTICEPTSENAVHYRVTQLPKIVSLNDYFNSSERVEKGFFSLMHWFNLALSTIKQIEKVHNNNKILGKLESNSIYYIEETQEVLLMDYSRSVPFDTPIRSSEGENKTSVLATQSLDVYALGDTNSPLTDLIKNASYHKNEPLEDKQFRQGLETCYLRYFLKAEGDKCPTLKEAKTVLTHLQQAYQGVVERARFLEIAAAFDKVEAKIGRLAQKAESNETKAEAVLREEKKRVLTEFQANNANKVMRCYLERPGTESFITKINDLCRELQSHDWRKDASTSKLYESRSSAGFYADIVLGGLLIGLIPMLIKAIKAAWQGKSFIQNFCLFSEIGSVKVLEKFVYEDMPRLDYQ